MKQFTAEHEDGIILGSKIHTISLLPKAKINHRYEMSAPVNLVSKMHSLPMQNQPIAE